MVEGYFISQIQNQKCLTLSYFELCAVASRLPHEEDDVSFVF